MATHDPKFDPKHDSYDFKPSAPPVAELLRLWKREELTADQMVGYMVQHLAEHERLLQQLLRHAIVPPKSSVATEQRK